MRSSSGMSTMIQTCVLLALATASVAFQPASNLAATTAPPAAATVVPRMQAVPSACNGNGIYLLPGSGETCDDIASNNGITLDEFLLMNPDINGDCSNLVIGQGYCIGATSPPPPPPPSSTPPPPPPPPPPPSPTPAPTTSPAVWNSVCTTTPSTCFSGSTGTDSKAYTTGCCNGCGPGGTCEGQAAANAPAGQMSYVCECGGVQRREAFNGLVGNATWVA